MTNPNRVGTPAAKSCSSSGGMKKHLSLAHTLSTVVYRGLNAARNKLLAPCFSRLAVVKKVPENSSRRAVICFFRRRTGGQASENRRAGGKKKQAENPRNGRRRTKKRSQGARSYLTDPVYFLPYLLFYPLAHTPLRAWKENPLLSRAGTQQLPTLR